MTALAKYVVQLEAETRKYVQELANANAALKKFHGEQTTAVKAINDGLSQLGSVYRGLITLAASFGVALSARGLVNLVSDALAAGAALSEMSKKTGTSVEMLSALQYVARNSGVNFETLVMSIQNLNVSLGRARATGGEARDAFESLGVNWRLLAQQSPEVRFISIVEALSRMKDETTRAALAQVIFQRSSKELAGVISGGADAMNKMIERAYTLGVTTTDMANSTEEAKNRIDELKQATTNLEIQLASKLAPTLINIADHIRKAFFPTEEERRLDKIKQLQDDLARTTSDLRSEEAALTATFPWERKESILKNIDTYKNHIRDLKNELIDLRFAGPVPGGAAGTGAGGAGGGNGITPVGLTPAPLRPAANPPPLLAKPGSPGSYEEIQKRLTGVDLSAAGLAATLLQSKIDKEKDFTAAIRAEMEKRSRMNLAAFNQATTLAYEQAQREIELRQSVGNATIGFLRAVGVEHRAASMIAIAWEKVQAIAQIHVLSVMAQARILAAYAPFPAIAIPLMAAVRIQYGIMEAMVAATGLAEIAQMSSGGAGAALGTPANPINTTSGAAGTAAGTPQGQRSVQIIFQGPVYGWDEFMRRRVVDSLRDLIDNRDVVIIGGDSRQAQELLGG